MKLTPGSVYQRQDGRWYWKFTIIHPDGARQRRAGSCGPDCTSRRAAQAILSTQRFDASNDTAPAPRSAPSLRAATQAFLDDRRPRLSHWHIAFFSRIVEHLRAVADPLRPLSQINHQTAQAYALRRLHLRRLTLDNEMNGLRTLLRWCAAHPRHWCHPDLYRVFGRIPHERPRPRTVPVASIMAVCAKLPPLQADLVLAALYTAARYGELARLQRQHVDLAAGVVWFERTKTRKPRAVPISPALRPILIRRLVAAADSPLAYVFPSPRPGRRSKVKGGPLSNIKKSLHKACAAAKLDPGAVNFQIIRHTACSLLAAIAPPHVEAQIAGHSVQTAERYYISISQDAKQAALNALSVAQTVARQDTQSPLSAPSGESIARS